MPRGAGLRHHAARLAAPRNEVEPLLTSIPGREGGEVAGAVNHPDDLHLAFADAVEDEAATAHALADTQVPQLLRERQPPRLVAEIEAVARGSAEKDSARA
jgi:hypothetical protein